MSFKTKTKEGLEETGRKGEIHDCPMRMIETKYMAYGQWVFKTYDR